MKKVKVINANTNENRWERMHRRFKEQPLASTIKAIGIVAGIIFLVLGAVGIISGISVGASFLSLLTSTAGIYSMLAIGSFATAGIASGYMNSQEKNKNDYSTDEYESTTTLTQENERVQKLAQLARNISEKEAAIAAAVQENTTTREQLQAAKDALENRESENNTITLPKQNYAAMAR